MVNSMLIKHEAEMTYIKDMKKGTPKNTLGFRPYQNQPFFGPHHIKKRGCYRKHPNGGQSTPSSN